MSKQVAIVVRHLGVLGSRPVACAIIQQPADESILHARNWTMEEYLRSKATEYIEEFKKDFIELEDAKFYIDILELSED
jgi:hypothetical protein